MGHRDVNFKLKALDTLRPRSSIYPPPAIVETRKLSLVRYTPPPYLVGNTTGAERGCRASCTAFAQVPVSPRSFGPTFDAYLMRGAVLARHTLPFLCAPYLHACAWAINVEKPLSVQSAFPPQFQAFTSLDEFTDVAFAAPSGCSPGPARSGFLPPTVVVLI